MKYEYNATHGIASIESPSGIKVLTILNNPENPEAMRGTFTAYLAARYSRSDRSIVEIADEVLGKDIDPGERMSTIIHGYGHASVQGLAHLIVCIENIPGYIADRFFYLMPLLDGQARSTRYQDFSKSNWPKKEGYLDLSTRYNDLMQRQVDKYLSIKTITNHQLGNYFNVDTSSRQNNNALISRTLDCARFLLPNGLYTSLASLMSAREWSRYISLMKGSSLEIERELGELLHILLVGNEELTALGYTPEAGALIRHIDSSEHETGVEAILSTVKNIILENQKNLGFDYVVESVLEVDVVISNQSLSLNILDNLLAMINPLALPNAYEEFNTDDKQEISREIFSRFNQYKSMGDIGLSDNVGLIGTTDMGSLRDLVRHRSLKKVIPIYTNYIDMDEELSREASLCFLLPKYLYNSGLEELRRDYSKHLKEIYEDIQEWYRDARSIISKEVATEYVRYLLPFAHRTMYRFYGDMDKLTYTILTRMRPGGHINYRCLVYEWLEALSDNNCIWKGLLDTVTKPDCTSKEEFLNRS